MVQIVRRARRRVWSIYSNAQRVSSLHLSKGCLNPPSRSDTYSSSAEGVAMDWKTMLGYVSGSVDEKLLLRNGYLVAENRVLRNQIQGRLRLTDAKRPGATVLSPFVFLDTTGWRSRIRSGGIHAFAVASPHLQATVLLECRARMSRISPGLLDTSHAQRPKPPCVLTARTHSSRNRRLVWSCSLSRPLVSNTSMSPEPNRIRKSGRYLRTTPR